MSWMDKKLIVVTGKGGVGKSTVAAALALRAARASKKVLLVELGEGSGYKPMLNMAVTPNMTPQKIADWEVLVAHWDTESCLKEYVLHYVKLPGIHSLFFDNKVMRSFIDVAPALKELALLGKLTSGERKIGPPFTFDLVIVDGYATGHMLSLLRAPKGMSESIRTGPMGQHSAEIYKTLVDAKTSGYCLVTLPDTLPTTEALELTAQFKSEFGIVPEIFVNRVLEPPANFAQGEGLETFKRYLATITKRQASNINLLKETGLGVVTLPLVLDAESPKQIIEKLSEAVPLQ